MRPRSATEIAGRALSTIESGYEGAEMDRGLDGQHPSWEGKGFVLCVAVLGQGQPDRGTYLVGGFEMESSSH